MTEHTLKTTVPPPEGWEYQGEFRPVKFGEWYLQFGKALNWSSQNPSENCFPILRRPRWVPKPGGQFWTATTAKHVHDREYRPDNTVDVELLEIGDCWRTREQAEAFAAACRALAERMHNEQENRT
jgi:hypothetical protein